MAATHPARRATDVRGHNLELVLRLVDQLGEVDRAELTRRTGLNRSTIAGLVADLERRGLVCDRRPTGGGKAGRPSHLVVARQDGPYTVAVDLDVGRVVVALVGLGGVVLGRATAPLADGVAAPAAARVVDELLMGLESTVAPGSWPGGVGVSVPGTVRRAEGVVRSAPNLGWVDVPLAALLAVRVGRRHPGLGVAVGNDADLGARAEHLRGAARGVDDVVYLCGHGGIGAGVIAGGTPLSGAHGFSGELGHMVVQLDGPRCRCGGRGCLETMVGAPALCALAGPEYAGPGAVERLLDDAERGAGPAAAAVRTVADRFGTALATVVNLLDPRMVVVGGLLKPVLCVAGAEVATGMSRQLGAQTAAAVTVCPPGLGADSSLLGAAELGFEQLLDATLDHRRPTGGPR